MVAICPLNLKVEMCLAVRDGSMGPLRSYYPMLGNTETDRGQRKNPAAAKKKIFNGWTCI